MAAVRRTRCMSMSLSILYFKTLSAICSLPWHPVATRSRRQLPAIAGEMSREVGPWLS